MRAAERIARDPADVSALALLLAAIAPGKPDPAAIARGAAEVDWPRLLAFAARHRVLPRLADALIASGSDVPAGPRAKLDAVRRMAAFEESEQAALLNHFGRQLDAAGIDWVVLKGVPLSLRLHARLGLRTSRDIDLLVAPGDVDATLDCAARYGFAPVGSGSPDAAARRRHKDVELVEARTGLIVELHWRPFDNAWLLPMPASLPRTVAELGGWGRAPSLEPATELRYLALHGAEHGWSRLKWLADFAGVAAAMPRETLAAIRADASVRDGRRALESALRLSDLLLGTRLAGDARPDRRTRWLVRSALAGLKRSGPREIEAIPFGSTRKNASHYLLSAAPAYLLEELRFDLRAPMRGGRDADPVSPLARLGEWLAYQRRRGA